MIFLRIFLCFLLAPSLALAITCNCYVRSSDGSDLDDCSTWALAHATVDQALTDSSAGDTICVDDDHSETYTTTKTFATVGSAGNPVKIVVVQTDTTTPVTAYGASPNIEATGSGDILKFGGYAYFYGIYIKHYDGLRFGTGGGVITIEGSKLEDVLTDAGSFIGYNSGDSNKLVLIDTDIDSGWFQTRTQFEIDWRGGAYLSTGTPHAYLIDQAAEGGAFHVEGVDLSLWDGSTSIINLSSIGSLVQEFNVEIKNSKMPLSYTLVSSNGLATGVNDGDIIADAIGNADEVWTTNQYNYAGIVTNDNTIYRTGGSTYTAKLATNANAKENVSCLRTRLFGYAAVDATTSADAAVHLTYDDATVWNNDDFSIEVKYHDATDEALGQWARTKPTTAGDAGDRTAFTDVSSTETWTGTSGFTNPQEETHEINFTGADGMIEVFGVLCKPSSTAYIDLLPDITEN